MAESPHLPIDYADDGSLRPEHLHEWVEGSAVAEGIVRANVLSLKGEEVLDYLAIADQLDAVGADGKQYATAAVRRLLHRREPLMAGGWWCSGVDLQNGCNTRLTWGLFKPDAPLIDEQRVRKYEHPAKQEERILALLLPGDSDYWARIKADPSITVVLDEGAKKAAAWLTAGIPGLCLPGLWAGTPPLRCS